MNGVMINLNSSAIDNYMLDLTPETTTRTDPALVVNRTYTDSVAGVSVTPLSVSDSGAVIDINFSGVSPSPTPTPTCAMANPTVSVSPATTMVLAAGSSASYTVIVTNHNSSSCTSNSFDLQAAVPTGWSVSSSTPTLIVAPGSSVSAIVQVGSLVGQANGLYTASLGAANAQTASYSATLPRDISVFSSLGVSVATNQSSYTSGSTVVMTANVSASDSPVSGASVSFVLTKPNGKTASASAVTNSSGVATFSYRTNKKQDPTGIYSVNAAASLSGISGSGATSFAVR